MANTLGLPARQVEAAEPQDKPLSQVTWVVAGLVECLLLLLGLCWALRAPSGAVSLPRLLCAAGASAIGGAVLLAVTAIRSRHR